VNFVIFQFAGGNVFFLGSLLLAGSLLLLARLKGMMARSFGRALFLIGFAGVACSGTPLDRWIYWALGSMAITCLILCESPRGAFLSRFGAMTLLLFCAALVGVCVSEWLHRIAPGIRVSSSQRVYVVGDSVSAGVGAGVRLWPEILGDSTKLKVVNLAKAGATASSALRQAKAIASGRSLVLLEIGGNDVIGETNPADFHAALDALLSRFASDGHEVAMFELPLPPFHNAYGEIQRALARRYGFPLIPKTCLANVFARSDATTDGIHLTQLGQEALAEAVRGMLVIEATAPRIDAGPSLE
jgi:acyl-CoA thioesterase-1